MNPVFVDELVETETKLVVDNVRDVRAVCSQQGGDVGYGQVPVGVYFFFIEKMSNADNKIVFFILTTR